MTSADGLIVKSKESLPELPYSSSGEFCLESLKKGGNRVAFVDADTGEETTYQEILQKCVNLGSSLRSAGIRKGDVIGLISENRVEVAVTVWATWLIGATYTPINVLSTPDEIEHYFGLSKPKRVFTTPSKYEDVQEALRRLQLASSVVVFDSKSSNGFEKLTSQHSDIATFKVTPVQPDDCNLILYSSGTTGLPKAVLLTDRNQMVYPPMIRANYTTLFTDNNACIIAVSPFSHTLGMTLTLNMALMNVKTVLIKRFHAESFYRIIEKYKVTFGFFVPTIMNLLATDPIALKYNLSSIKYICVGGTKASEEIVNLLYKRLKIEVRESYGSTETGSSLINPEFGKKKIGSIGLILPALEGKVCDIETDAKLGPNKLGELRLRGPGVMKGYMNVKDSGFDSEGFFKTGDLVYYDEEGYFFFEDRLKDMIKYKAYQISPTQLENIILEIEGVKDVGVIGIPNKEGDELPAAFIEKLPGAKVTEAQVKAFTDSKVSPYKKLRGGVFFVDSLPRGKTGKILRRELRVLLQKRLSSKL